MALILRLVSRWLAWKYLYNGIKLKEISHFQYYDNLESTRGTRFQTNHADNRIRIVNIAVCKTPKAVYNRHSDGRVLTGLCRLHSTRYGGVFHRRLEGIRIVLIFDPLPNNVSQKHGMERKVSSYWAWSTELRLCYDRRRNGCFHGVADVLALISIGILQKS